MPIYSIDLKVAATAYVRANSKQEAIDALRDEIGNFCDLDDFEISDLAFNNPELPDISLSPAMTVHGPWGHWANMDEAE